MKFEILTYGDSLLRQTAKRVEAVTPEIRQLAADMLSTMRIAHGVGLAATQIGRPLALCVIEIPPANDVLAEGGPRQNPDVPMPLVLVNPEIAATSEEQATQDEGCLSFPEIQIPIRRAVSATVRFMDLKGALRTLETRHLVARAVQHEVDHLRGILLVDRMSPLKRISLAGRLKKLKKKTRETLNTISSPSPNKN